MHAAMCLLRAGQPGSAGDATKSGQFIGKFSWVTGDPIGLKGLIRRNKIESFKIYDLVIIIIIIIETLFISFSKIETETKFNYC